METIEVLGSAEAGKNFPKILEDVCGLSSLDDILQQLCHRLGSTDNQPDKFCQVNYNHVLKLKKNKPEVFFIHFRLSEFAPN